MATKNYVDYDPETNNIVEETVNKDADGKTRSRETVYYDNEQMHKDFVKDIKKLISEQNLYGGLLVAWTDKDELVAVGSDVNGDNEDRLAYGLGQMMGHERTKDIDVTEDIAEYYNKVLSLTAEFQAGILSGLSDSATAQLANFMKTKNEEKK